MSSKEIINIAQEKMNKSHLSFQEKAQTIRTGRASANQFEHLSVLYYGTPTPLNQVGNVSIPEPRLVVIQPWDASVLPEIEKAIINSNLSLNPQNDGKLIRINIPPLTDETRGQNIKQVKQLSEEAKVALRNIRREANDKLKKLEHSHEMSEDDLKAYEADMQEMTDAMTKKINEETDNKEKEINEV